MGSWRRPRYQHNLDAACQREGDAQREQKPLPSRTLERLPAEVLEQRRIEGPEQRRRGVEQGKVPPRE